MHGLVGVVRLVVGIPTVLVSRIVRSLRSAVVDPRRGPWGGGGGRRRSGGGSSRVDGSVFGYNTPVASRISCP